MLNFHSDLDPENESGLEYCAPLSPALVALGVENTDFRSEPGEPLLMLMNGNWLPMPANWQARLPERWYQWETMAQSRGSSLEQRPMVHSPMSD